MSGTTRDDHPSVEELDAVLDSRDGDPQAAAGDVQAHVSRCERCRQAVADLSEVRGLLRAGAAHVPPPPEDLDERIAAALADAAREGGPHEDGVAPAVPEVQQHRASATVVPMRERSRVPRWAAVAAGLLVLGGAGLTAGQVLGGEGPVAGTAAEDAGSAPESAAAGAGGEASAAARVVATGTDYDAESLDEQVVALLDAAGGGEAEGGGQEERAPLPGVASDSPVRLSDPADLDACLEALGADASSAPVVDLATWQGQEVAVIVLDEGSRHTVWVVDRGCRPGADGLVHYQVLTR